jgi:hypothetical protein
MSPLAPSITRQAYQSGAEMGRHADRLDSSSRRLHFRAAALVFLVAFTAMGCSQEAASTTRATVAATQEAELPVISKQEMDEAIAVRTSFGLNADQTWIRRVAADPAARPGIEEFGIPLMPFELTDLMSRRWDGDLLAKVTAYGRLFPDEFAGASINLKATGVIVAFTGRVDRHAAAHSNLVPAGAVVEVREARWSLKDLEGFIKQVESQRAWFDTLGVTFKVGDFGENFVLVKYRGPKEAGELIQNHFGDPPWLKAEWVGPPPWNGPRADLVIKVTDDNGQPIKKLWVEFLPIDPMVDVGGEEIFGTGANGICVLSNIPAVAYQVRLHEWIGNDHYDPIPIREFRVVLAEEGTTFPVVIPAT